MRDSGKSGKPCSVVEALDARYPNASKTGLLAPRLWQEVGFRRRVQGFRASGYENLCQPLRFDRSAVVRDCMWYPGIAVGGAVRFDTSHTPFQSPSRHQPSPPFQPTDLHLHPAAAPIQLSPTLTTSALQACLLSSHPHPPTPILPCHNPIQYFIHNISPSCPATLQPSHPSTGFPATNPPSVRGRRGVEEEGWRARGWRGEG